MPRTLSIAPAAAVVVFAMVSLAPPAVATEPAASPTATATTSSHPTSGASDQPSGHVHETAPEGGTVTSAPATVTVQPQPDPAPAEDEQGTEHAEGHTEGADERAPGDGETTEGGHTDAEEHSDAAVPEDRPRAVVLGGFGLFNSAVLLYAARLRRRTSLNRRRHARVASLTTDTSTAAKESR